MQVIRLILGVLVGAAMIAGAAAGWKFWHIDGFLAFLLGCAGASVIGTALNVGSNQNSDDDEEE